MLDRIDLLYGVALPEPERTWSWDFAPLSEVVRGSRLVHRVAAWPNWHA